VPKGLTYVKGVVTGPTGVSRTVEFLVDSGAKYSLLPLDVWQALGLVARRRLTFVLEILGFILHPFNRTIQPARLILA
jgi:hypothetical protein